MNALADMASISSLCLPAAFVSPLPSSLFTLPTSAHRNRVHTRPHHHVARPAPRVHFLCLTGATSALPKANQHTDLVVPDSIEILHLADTWVAVNKPPGILVHRTKLYPHGRGERFLLDLVREAMGVQRGKRTTVLPVHRLDRPTSGIVVFGLDETRNAAMVQEAMQATTARKQYWTLAFGSGMDDHWENNHPLKDLTGKNRKQRPALTQFEKLIEYDTAGVTAVRATLGTGRRHQIRRHLSYSRFPVVGDTSHGDSRLNHAAHDSFDVPRCCLHARRLEFTDPFTKERIHLSVPVPQDLRDMVTRIPGYSSEHDEQLDLEDSDPIAQ